ncbi:hypothetical protein SDC9_53757 [bioreactor metagenome]|uniref:Uncharacterized protein n=1 Tax=bioreactor metagenome TaxID=1076179 RepID=A0A644WV30_9ZZZZ
MSKFFMYGTELQDIEQMMMLVPNFIPRRSGVVVVKKLQYENEGVTCHDCDRYKRSRCHDNTLSCFAEKVASGEICYEKIVNDYYMNFKSYSLKKRIGHLIRNFNGDIFLNPIHHYRFNTILKLQNEPIKNRKHTYLATLFLLTADDNLCRIAKDHIYQSSFNFKNMRLNGINTDGYALYQTARTIYTGIEHIKMSEIADETLIGTDAFKAIINATMIARYGADMFQVNC